MSALGDLAAAADETLGPYAIADPGPGAYESLVPDPNRAFVIEAVREAYLLHYAEPRAFHGMDADMRLLAGDALYALGLARLADAGDLAGVTELTDLISQCARLQSEGQREDVEELWEASAEALARGLPEPPNR